jgi:hypothetical protein
MLQSTNKVDISIDISSQYLAVGTSIDISSQYLAVGTPTAAYNEHVASMCFISV